VEHTVFKQQELRAEFMPETIFLLSQEPEQQFRQM
jgi:hypothetical protein